MLVAIHQPNFFPWLGYFDKLARSDAFIFLDNVQFPKTGGTWMNRVRMSVAGESRWITATVDRSFHGTRTVREMVFLDAPDWRERARRTIENAYGKHPHFRETMDVVVPLLANPERHLTIYNVMAVRCIASGLGLDTVRLHKASELDGTGRSNALLCGLVKAVSGCRYLCGGGAGQYHDETVYRDAGIDIVLQDFRHPVYAQRGGQQFQAGLSIIDALMNLGWQGTRELLDAGKC